MLRWIAVNASNAVQPITIEDAANIRSAIAAGRFASPNGTAGTALSLSAAVEFAGWLAQANGSSDALRRALGRVISNCPRFRAAEKILQGKIGLAAFPSVESDIELMRIGKMDGADVAWHDYLQRFSDALARRSMDKKYARTLAMSLHEMADNVVQHAANNGDAIPRNVVGWHAFPGGAAFVVLDLGRGIRRSLAENPKWSGLANDRECLRSVLRQHASSRVAVMEGNGFKDVVKNFVERNGVLRIRTGSCEVVAEGTLTDSRERYLPLPALNGTRASAWCRPYSKLLGTEPEI